MTEHFPTPWHVDKYAMSIYAADVRQGSPRVADLRGWGYLTGKGHGALGLSDDDGVKAQRANAELIVKAVNNHDALIEALKPFGFYFDLNDCDDRTDDDALEIPIGDLRRARDLLRILVGQMKDR